MPVTKSFDRKLAQLKADPSCREFILADAKDGDMGFGIGAPGLDQRRRNERLPYRSLAEYRDFMREIVRQELVDIMLMSASSCELLAIDEKLFADSRVTPAARANDTTDIWLGLGPAAYTKFPSLPFRTATIDHIQSGTLGGGPDARGLGADLGLYSVTFNNDPERDRDALDEYREFRIEAELRGFRHFLEVFAPNAPVGLRSEDVPRFVNDSIARLLGGITRRGRPLFLKMPYFGPAAMEQLFHYDPTLVIGILGGSAGTTFDAFHLLAEAKKYGARAALFGRKINQAEDQLSFLRHLRAVADEQIDPAEAVRSYHGDLARQGIVATRHLDDDLRATS